MNPKWDCGSASYYSRLTDINYEKVKSKLKAKLKEETPPKVTISTDGWTQHYDAFLGINFSSFFCIKDIGIAGFWNGIPSLFRYRPALEYRPVTDFYGIPAEG